MNQRMKDHGNFRLIHVDDLEAVTRIAHQPALSGEILELLEAGVNFDAERFSDPEDLEEATI